MPNRATPSCPPHISRVMVIHCSDSAQSLRRILRPVSRTAGPRLTQMVLQIGSSGIIINAPRDGPCQILQFWVYHIVHFPRNGQNMALLWPKHGPHMVLQIGSSWIIINVPRDAPCQISNFWVYPIVLFSRKGPKYGPFMAKTWSPHVPSNWFFLNYNQYAQGCSMPNFTTLGVSHSPLSLEMAKIWHFMAKTWSSHCSSNWLFLNHSQYALGCSLPNFTILGVSYSPLFLEMAKIWPFCGQNMVLTWSHLTWPDLY